jgi:hypothetical protein
LKNCNLLRKYIFLSLITLSFLEAVELKNGWNLIGNHLDGVEIAKIAPEADVVYKYIDSQWQVASPNKSVQNINFESFSTVEAGV